MTIARHYITLSSEFNKDLGTPVANLVPPADHAARITAPVLGRWYPHAFAFRNQLKKDGVLYKGEFRLPTARQAMTFSGR
jgi:hypothetical protein